MTTIRIALVVAMYVSGAAVPAHAATAGQLIVLSPGDSIQAAVQQLRSGGVIELRGGVYHQRVHLNGVRHLTIRPYAHEQPVLDGSTLRAPSGISALVAVANSRDVTIKGLELTGYRTSRLGVVPVGVYVHRHDHAIRIIGNHVHDLGNDNNTLGSFDINAHGVAVYGDDPHAAITRLAIRDNVVDNLHLGASESVVVNGNVNHWQIVGNRIYDNDNIGIDAIGFESTLTGKYRYTQRNRARHGVIADNVVSRIRSRGNPAYWKDGEWCNCADGVYIDGGSRITVRGNQVRDSDIGIEVAAENARGTADHVVVTRNHISGSLFTGITTGGYCNGADDCGGVETGSSHDNTFTHNTLRDNNRLDDGSPELLVQYHSYRDRFAYNTITATNSDHVIYGTVPNADTNGHPGTNRSDHNRFHAVGGSRSTIEFGWAGHTYTGFAAYRQATGQDSHSTFH
jgi:hypothetical protein